MNRKESASKDTFTSSALKPIITGTVAGLIVLALFLLLFAVVLSMKDLPLSAYKPITSVGCAIAALVAGFFASKIHQKQGLLIGMACGVALFVLIFLIGLIAGGTPLSFWTAVKFAVLIISGCVGGILGVNFRIKRKFKLK